MDLEVIESRLEELESESRKSKEFREAASILLASMFEEDEPDEVARWQKAHEAAKQRRERDRAKRET